MSDTLTIDQVVDTFDFTTTYQPSERDGLSLSLVFRATVKVKKTGVVVYDDTYSLGAAHIPGYYDILRACNSSHNRLTLAGAKVLDEILATGKYPTVTGKHDVGFVTKPLPHPKHADIIYSLLMDSSADDHVNYESWAAEYGFDPDSIKGLRTYEACCQIGRALRTNLGASWLEAARNAFQDY